MGISIFLVTFISSCAILRLVPPLSSRPPQRRSQWLLSFLLMSTLVLLSLYYLTNPQREEEQQYANAKEVPISEITQGYDQKRFEKILIRDNKVYVTAKNGDILQSYKQSEDTVSDLGWNDPQNATVVEVENLWPSCRTSSSSSSS